MVKSKRTGEDIITVPPITNAVLTTVFLAEVVGIFGMLLFRPGMTTSVGAPLVGAEAAAALAAACVVLFPTIQLVKLASEAVGGLLSRSLLKPLGDPLRKSKNMAKFKDQMWQLAIHVSMTLLEVWILYYDGGGEPWLDEYWSFWIPCAAAQRRRAILPRNSAVAILSAASVILAGTRRCRRTSRRCTCCTCCRWRSGSARASPTASSRNGTRTT
jgi:hypothetical protein